MQNLNFTDLNNDTLEGALKAHIVPGVYYTTNLTSEPTTVESVGGTNITLTNSDPSNNSSVTGKYGGLGKVFVDFNVVFIIIIII